jgi:hypothetical protein
VFASAEHAAEYLSGIIDGEGNISQRKVYRDGCVSGYVREVRITNTDEALLAAAQAALDLLGVAWVLRDRSERERLGTKPIFDIIVSRRENLERLAQALTLRSVKGERLARMLASYTGYGQRPQREEFERVLRESGQRGAAEHFGVSQGTIYNWRKHFGIEPNRSGRRLTVPPSE